MLISLLAMFYHLFTDYLLLHLFHNVSHSSISHIHIDVNESRHIYLSVGNARMTYIVKRRKYIANAVALVN